MTCRGSDPLCPCQDGDACHYESTATTAAWGVRPNWIPEAETADLRALEYWERGHRLKTVLRAHVVTELAKRGATPHGLGGMVPGRRGAIATMRRERAERFSR